MVNEVMIEDVPVAEANPRVAVTRPDQSTAQAIQDFGGIAGEAVEGIQRRRAAFSSQEVGQALSAADSLSQKRMVASREGRDLTPEEQLQIQESLTTDKARKHFATIAAGLDQRGFGRGQAAMRARTIAESEIRNIAGLTPGFSDSIRGAARDALGFDPTGETINSLFNSMQDPKEAEVKSEPDTLKAYLGSLYGTEVGKIAYGYLNQVPGATAESTMEYLRNTGQLEFYTDLMFDDMNLNRQGKNAKATTDGYIKTVNKYLDFSTLIGNMSENGKLSGGMDTLTQENTLAAIAAEKERVMTALTDRVQDPAQLKRAQELVDRKAAGLIRLVENTNSFDLLKEHVDTFQQLAKIDLINRDPEFMTYALGLNPQLADKVLTLKMNAGSEEALDHILLNYPGIKNLFDTDRGNEAQLYMQGAIDNVVTGRKNPFPAPTPELQQEYNRAAADTAIANGALADPETSPSVQNADKKLTYVRVAEDPSLALTIPDGEAWDTFKTNFGSDLELIAKQAAQDVLDAGLVEVEYGKFGTDNQLTFAMDENTPWWERFSILPDSIDRFNETFAPIMRDKRVSQRLFGGQPVSPEKFLASTVNANIQQIELERIEKNIESLERQAANYIAPMSRGANDPNRYELPTDEEVAAREKRTQIRREQYTAEAEKLKSVREQLKSNLDMYLDQQRKWGVQR